MKGRFLTSSTDPYYQPFPPSKAFYQGKPIVEFAIAGRSNAGKSSLINYLVETPHLAKVSATPGKTQLLNFFQWYHYLIVDLPGYGFAKVPEKVKANWGKMVFGCLQKRTTLNFVLLTWDFRRDPNEEDIQLFQWLQAHRRSPLIAFTKGDKISPSQRKGRLNELMHIFTEQLGAPPSAVLTSSYKRWGRDALLKMIEEHTQLSI